MDTNLVLKDAFFSAVIALIFGMVFYLPERSFFLGVAITIGSFLFLMGFCFADRLCKEDLISGGIKIWR